MVKLSGEDRTPDAVTRRTRYKSGFARLKKRDSREFLRRRTLLLPGVDNSPSSEKGDDVSKAKEREVTQEDTIEPANMSTATEDLTSDLASLQILPNETHEESDSCSEDEQSSSSEDSGEESDKENITIPNAISASSSENDLDDIKDDGAITMGLAVFDSEVAGTSEDGRSLSFVVADDSPICRARHGWT